MQDNNIDIEVMCYCECNFSGPVIGTYYPEDFRWVCPTCFRYHIESRYGDRGKSGELKFNFEAEEESCTQ